MNDKAKSEHDSSASRRRFLAALSYGAASATLLGAPIFARAVDGQQRAKIGLGFSLYGMKSLSLVDGIRLCREIGYDCTEIPAMADWPGDSLRLSAESRAEVRQALVDQKLRLSAIMENLPITGDDTRQRVNLERLRSAAKLARDLSPEQLPVVETILGGKPGQWENSKPKFVAELRKWSKVLAAEKVTLAIKAHVGNAMQQPEQVVWLLKEVDSPWVHAAYDYSHFQLQKLPVEETLAALLPRTKFVHVKDSQTVGERWQFELPGDGTIDYVDLGKRIAAGGYDGDIVVEVSGQVSSRAGYDPVAAAKKCYSHLAKAFAVAGIERG